MTNTEFSNEFDILYNNISSNQAPGLDEYEKSIFLTRAQEAIVLELYNGKNASWESFENTEEIRKYLSNLVGVKILEAVNTSSIIPISNTSQFFILPDDLWFIVHESVKYENKDVENIEIVPVTHDEYNRIAKNPFRKPKDKRVLRIDVSKNDDTSLIELVPTNGNYIGNYTIRYIKTLQPIILEDLNGLSINGKSNKTECKLNPALHYSILERAVLLAKASMGTLK
jgi:hypothetical protein